MQDIELIQGILAGNRENFELLIKQYQSNVFRVAIGLVHSKQDAEEISQDVFLKVYQSLKDFNKEAAFSTWLYRITINTSLNFLRSRKRNKLWSGVVAFFQSNSAEASVEAKMIEDAGFHLIKGAIDDLPEKQRLAFVLTKYEDLSEKKVADIMSITEGAVEQLVLRAKNNLRKKLGPAVGYFPVPLSNNKTKLDEKAERH
jgi:RNA polymerase sigma-70 factor, ECF subfamily